VGEEPCVVMAFVQVIEMTTTKVAEIEQLVSEWVAATEGRRSAHRGLLTKDRDRPDTYVQVVEFPSYEEAMANSALPETAAFAEKLSALCVSEPTFRNLDVVRVDEL
jgi:quinol monooxygenase YgiN